MTRVVYLDETGHDAGQTVTVVAGVLLDPDAQWRTLATRIDDLKKEVPEQFREGFYFHASTLQYGGKNRDAWPDEDRWALLDKLVALPRELSIPLVMGFTRKQEPRDQAHRESIITHAMAYGYCLKAADWFMCEKAPPHEIAMIVAEERKEASKALRAM